MTQALAILLCILSVAAFWATWIFFSLSLPYMIGYLFHSSTGDLSARSYNLKKSLFYILFSAVAYGLGFIITWATIKDSSILSAIDNNSFTAFIIGTFGSLPSFINESLSSWYFIATLVISVVAGFFIYGIIGALLSTNAQSPIASTIPISIASGITAICSLILRQWLPDRPRLSIFHMPEGDGLYIPYTVLLIVLGSGVLAGLIIKRYEYYSGIGGAWIFHIVGGLIGLVIGVLFMMHMTTTNWLIIIISPSFGVFLASNYVAYLISHHKFDYKNVIRYREHAVVEAARAAISRSNKAR